MRIRKHLSGLHLPHSGEEASNLATTISCPPCDSSSSSRLMDDSRGDGKGNRFLKCRTGVLKVYSRTARRDMSSLSDADVSNDPRTPTSCPPRRNLLSESFKVEDEDNSCMQQVEGENSFFVPEENAYPQQQRPIVEHIFPVLRDVGIQNPAHVEEVRGNEEIPIERDLLLPLSSSQIKDGDDGKPPAVQVVQPRNSVELNDDDLNQCRRRDGKGWRCHRKTQPAYSLCEYHLDKSRETHQRKLKNNATAGEPKRKYVRRKPVKARSLLTI